MSRLSRHYTTLALAVLLASLPILALGAPPTLQAHPRDESSFHKIRREASEGLITDDQRLAYEVTALFAPDKLPARFRSDVLEKCGTPVLAEVEARWKDLPASVRAQVSQWSVAASARGLSAAQSRPGLSGQEQTLTTPHFLIHYTTFGPDAVDPRDANFNGTPDYVDKVAQAFEQSRSIEVDTLGWLEPPSDAPLDPFSPWYDVYLQGIPVEGMTYPEDIAGDNEHSIGVVEPYARYSYIILNSRLSDDLLKVTAAHEYNHAIQFGYNAASLGFDARRWLMEGTATWMEDQVFDDVNDNVGYLPMLFSQPDRSLVRPENEYASWLFFEYVEEHLGGQQTMRRMWERAVPLTGDFSVEVIRQALGTVGGDLDSAFSSFCAANLLMLPCDLTSNATCYSDALLYIDQAGSPQIEGRVSLDSGEFAYPASDGVEPLACDYVQVGSQAARMAASGYVPSPYERLQGMWAGVRQWSADLLPFWFSTDPNQPGVETEPQRYDDLYLIIANLSSPSWPEPAAVAYGLAFSVTDASTPTPTATATATATPTATLTPSPTPTRRTPRLFLPVIPVWHNL